MDVIQVQQNALQDKMTSMQNSLMDKIRMGFLRLTELICLNKVADKLNEENTTDLSQNENIQDYQPSVPRVVKSPEFVVVSETSEDVKQLTRPPKLTIKVPRDHKRSAFTVSPYVDPTAKRPRKPKMPEFGSISQVDEEIVHSMQTWINDNKNTSMYTGLLEAKPAWFELLLSANGWLEGDFPANVNGNHWVAVEVDLKEWVIKVFDSKPDAYSVDQILKWATCLRKMLPSLLAYAMPDTYTDPSSFTVERPEKGVQHQQNQSDCGVFTLKFLEYLWVRKQFDFGEKDGEPFRIQLATEIFQNLKEVPCVNDEPLCVNVAT
ncbi:hypothetical protein Dsin_019587 [Dipteronia sinensis]|uniref:Ubiquitin-like protease family profile domain-containing protein n=1 Tax=Dipteronia sinensis TaxID=43782 RepID=A0AAE0E368_9ROSI|nr:hypothetical protein Dsin_019587 [Dipteronia sinensis]